MIKVLHVIPHFGGGAGVVLTALIDAIAENSQYYQSVVCFEYLNQFGETWQKKSGILVVSEVSPRDEQFLEQVEAADIVHVHFWNHPALYLFLYSFSGRKARMVFWAHVNGHYAPYLFNETVLNYSEIFVTASVYSRLAPAILKKDSDWRNEHICSIHSSSGTKGFEYLKPVKHNGFRIGYVGTVDYCKMHRNFIDICSKIDIPDLKVVVCGGPDEKRIKSEAEKQGVGHLFDFCGHVHSVAKIFQELDLFIYPLAKENYGTGEQVLIEAMSAGVPQVVLDNGPESCVIKDGVTGIVAGDVDLFVEAVVYLYKRPDLREKFSVESRKYAMAHYSIKKITDAWLRVYEIVLARTKHSCQFDKVNEVDIPVELFLKALGECPEAELYKELKQYIEKPLTVKLKLQISRLSPIFTGETRGSVRHYSRFFKNEKSCIQKLTEMTVTC